MKDVLVFADRDGENDYVLNRHGREHNNNIIEDSPHTIMTTAGTVE